MPSKWAVRFLVWALPTALLAGCARDSITVRAFDRVLDAWWRDASAFATPPIRDSRYAHLRVQVHGVPSTVLMVLGYVDEHPDGVVQVWYSADHEVIRLQDGRLAGAVGLLANWQGVRLTSSPRWREVPPAGVHWQRERDDPDEYRYGIREDMFLRDLGQGLPQGIADKLPKSVDRDQAVQWRWYSEMTAGLPTAWFARAPRGGVDTTVYSFQCLSRDFCLHLQPWPPEVSGGVR